MMAFSILNVGRQRGLGVSLFIMLIKCNPPVFSKAPHLTLLCAWCPNLGPSGSVFVGGGRGMLPGYGGGDLNFSLLLVEIFQLASLTTATSIS